MSMSMHVVGFKPPDEKFKRMLTAWKACKDAGIRPPKEVLDFFEGDEPDENGVRVNLEKSPAVKEYQAEMQNGYEVNLDKLPKDVRIIRFVCNY